MPAAAPRCTDCNAPLRAVPAWLATAKVSFTCISCPKRSGRSVAATAAAPRFDAPISPRAAVTAAPDDVDAEDADTEDLDDVDLDTDVEVDDVKEDDA